MKDDITNVVAATMVTAPAWGPWLDSFNQLLTSISLICGICWIAIQMSSSFNKKYKNRPLEKDDHEK